MVLGWISDESCFGSFNATITKHRKSIGVCPRNDLNSQLEIDGHLTLTEGSIPSPSCQTCNESTKRCPYADSRHGNSSDIHSQHSDLPQWSHLCRTMISSDYHSQCNEILPVMRTDIKSVMPEQPIPAMNLPNTAICMDPAVPL